MKILASMISMAVTGIVRPFVSRTSRMGTTYLIHFDRPFNHARHYLGWTSYSGVEGRLERHRTGDGSKLLRAVAAAGIGFEIVREWRDTSRDFERSLKNKKNSPKLCPLCREGKEINGTDRPCD